MTPCVMPARNLLQVLAETAGGYTPGTAGRAHDRRRYAPSEQRRAFAPNFGLRLAPPVAAPTWRPARMGLRGPSCPMARSVRAPGLCCA